MAERPYRISAHALDVVFKLEAEQLARLLPLRLGIPISPIKGYFLTELPQVDLHLERLDSCFEQMDGGLLDVEFEHAVSVDGMARFVGYGMALIRAYKRPARTIVLFGPSVRTAPPSIDCGLVPYHLDCILIADWNGAATLDRLRRRVANAEPWSEEDLLDLVVLPLMRHAEPFDAVVDAAMELAATLPKEEANKTTGALLGLAYHYLGETALNRLMEAVMASNLLEKVLTDAWETGRVEGSREMLLRFLTRRFGSLPPDIGARLGAISDMERLDSLVDLAAHAATPEEFLAAL